MNWRSYPDTPSQNMLNSFRLTATKRIFLIKNHVIRKNTKSVSASGNEFIGKNRKQFQIQRLKIYLNNKPINKNIYMFTGVTWRYPLPHQEKVYTAMKGHTYLFLSFWRKQILGSVEVGFKIHVLVQCTSVSCFQNICSVGK